MVSSETMLDVRTCVDFTTICDCESTVPPPEPRETLHNHRSEDIDLRQERARPTLQGERPAPTDLSRPQLHGH